MNTTLSTIALVILALHATHAAKSATSWTAQDTGGRSVAIRQDPGDAVTVPIPGPNKVPLRIAFLVHPITNPLVGRTVSATFWIDASNPVYVGHNAGGCVNPANFRLYFTSTTGVYKVSSADRYPERYWWSQAGACYIEQVDDGALVTITATVTPETWSHALGQPGSALPSQFNAAATNAKQLGLSFGGGCFYDTGIGMASGSATLHLVSLTVNTP